MNFRLFILLLTLSPIFVGCIGVFEKDISEKIPTVIAPKDSAVVSSFTNFLWEKMDGAATYRLNIVSPTFDSINSIVLDSMVTKNEFFILVIDPDRYQYKITALNNGYSSLSTPPITFFVDSASGGGNAQITLLQPQASKFYNLDFDKYFSWTGLPNISSYEFSLRKGSNYEIGELVYTQNNISNTNVSVSSVEFEEGIYVWGVKAIFTTGQSTNVFTNTFKIDGTPPPRPNPVTPVDESVVTSPVTFTWTTPSDVGVIKSPIRTRIEVSTDSLFSTLNYSKETTDTSEEIEIDDAGTYYWQLKNIDDAGNESNYSEFKQFVIN